MSTSTKDFVIDQLRKQIEGFSSTANEESVGKVIAIGDGIAKISGLREALMSEMLEFSASNGERVYGVALNLEEDTVGAIILGDPLIIKEGDNGEKMMKMMKMLKVLNMMMAIMMTMIRG